jgi:hypothetical protein
MMGESREWASGLLRLEPRIWAAENRIEDEGCVFRRWRSGVRERERRGILSSWVWDWDSRVLRSWRIEGSSVVVEREDIVSRKGMDSGGAAVEGLLAEDGFSVDFSTNVLESRF